ncbi:response regulator transcription factor [Acidicapsa acidisoli]|uniref:response regulator transcription factor n=1 Tax=Acidicapsa acidisoli TaxID=1615681 RepID=UPI0021E0F0FA|nr:response regulator transcription factor [Acidicapsa acidisoli]
MNSIPEKVLVVAEEASQRFQLRHTLNAFGFDLGEASNGAHALLRLRMMDYEAVLLHSPAPEADGIEVCRQLRNFNARLPVLILSDRDSLDHRVMALETGADDYMIRPVAERELTARLRSAIRRYRAPLNPTPERLVVRDIVLDPTLHMVEKAGTNILLTPLEFRALHILMEQAGKPVTHATLLTTLWGPERAQRREHLRVLIGGLRKKLENDTAHPEYLITHPHLGYLFAVRTPSAELQKCS